MVEPTEHPLDSVARLLADHDSMLGEDERFERDAEVAQRITWVWGQMSLVDRCAGALGRSVQIEVAGCGWVTGVLADIGADWVELRTEQGLAYVCSAAVSTIVGVDGAGRSPQDVSKVDKARDLRQLLRHFATERTAVELRRTDGAVLGGRVVRVGADHVDVETNDGASVCLASRGIALIRAPQRN